MSGDSLFWESMDARVSKLEKKLDGIMKVLELMTTDLRMVKVHLGIE